MAHDALRRTLLFRAFDLTEFDDSFRRKRKFTSEASENVLRAALRALTAPVFDSDAVRNLRIIENLEKRVMASVESGTLEAVMLEAKATEAEIDEIAYRVYGVEEQRAAIEEALRMVL